MKVQIVYAAFVLAAALLVSCAEKEELPVVTTLPPKLGPRPIISGCQIKSDGSSAVMAFGVCWSSNPNPTLDDNFTASIPGKTKFSYDTLNGFEYNTTYYVRAYATNAGGTAYGESIEATAYMNYPQEDVTDIDGNVYKTVRIGDQVWMVENLKTTRFRNGDPIPSVTDGSTWAKLTTPGYCNYNNDPKLGDTYGRLYNLKAVEDPRKIAPEGWRVPVSEDWIVLRQFLGNNCYERMEETGTAHWKAGNETADNISGFTALPSGHRGLSGSFQELGYVAYFWCSGSLFPVVTFGYYQANRCDAFRSASGDEGFAVRCIKEE